MNGYRTISEINDVLQSGYYASPLGCYNIDWFVEEVTNLENKMAFSFKITNKDIILTEEDEEDFKTINTVEFVKKKYFLIK